MTPGRVGAWGKFFSQDVDVLLTNPCKIQNGFPRGLEGILEILAKNALDLAERACHRLVLRRRMKIRKYRAPRTAKQVSRMLVADGLKFLSSILVLLFDAKFVLIVVFSCPVSDCTFDGPLNRVLAHLRSPIKRLSCCVC